MVRSGWTSSMERRCRNTHYSGFIVDIFRESIQWNKYFCLVFVKTNVENKEDVRSGSDSTADTILLLHINYSYS